MNANANEIQVYLDSMHGVALVQVDILQDGFVTSRLDDNPCADFAVAEGALAWVHGYGRPHALFAQHVVCSDDFLTVWQEFADTGYGWRVNLSPVWTADQIERVAAWQQERAALPADRQAQIRGTLLEACVGAAHDHNLRREVDPQEEFTYLVAGVDRSDSGAMGLRTVGVLVVAVDGSVFKFVGLPGVDETGIGAEFDQRAQHAARHGTAWVDLFTYLVQHGNGYTSDYSVPETVRATNEMRAGYKWLRKVFATKAPHIVV